MQSIFRLDWYSDSQDKFCDKLQMQKPRSNVSVDNIPLVNNLATKFKRKRADEASPPPNEPLVKKAKLARETSQPVASSPCSAQPDAIVKGKVKSPAKQSPLQTQASAASSSSTPEKQLVAQDVSDAKTTTSATTAAEDMTPLQQAIEAHFSMEILMKHRELELIEQELAKAQIALEQLRRCQHIPYPGTSQLSENVSNGTGPALRPQPGYTQPAYAAPWGVTDGPYTKHYQKWLIPDPAFDSVPLSSLNTGMEGRTTRHSFLDAMSGPKPRTSRNSSSGLKLDVFANAATPTTPKIDPLLHKRSSDGKWVRLFCPECKHSNFSNTQGFLNHCRIKHAKVFKSHDQAANDWGVVVDVDELGSALPVPPGATTPAVIATPVTATTSTPLTTPGFNTNSRVSHLNTALTPKSSQPLPPRRVGDALMTPRLTPNVKHHDYFGAHAADNTRQENGNAKFVPSPHTPYMSSHLEKLGSDTNLREMVDTMRTKVDLSAIDIPSDDDQSPRPSGRDDDKASQQMARMPSRGGLGPSHRPVGQKRQSDGVRSTGTHRAPSALNLGGADSLENSNRREVPESPAELSPNTVESNPGLISDHDDDDDEDDNCSVHHLDNDGDHKMEQSILIADGSDAECDRRKRLEFRKSGPSN